MDEDLVCSGLIYALFCTLHNIAYNNFSCHGRNDCISKLILFLETRGEISSVAVESKSLLPFFVPEL